ncbi:hypothetical protein Tdes44962_MAKER05976 [Teratosphaeria destructans]|uniref:Uncharacterized protein n=1 Tax=Teratosphaeria destructans TaxID=418781 RepID=A0A9W7VXZ2_9PEZI|nr:hypothetical protein Tdes44962_MAKER05976 [Teratosphaeria destructans]
MADQDGLPAKDQADASTHMTDDHHYYMQLRQPLEEPDIQMAEGIEVQHEADVTIAQDGSRHAHQQRERASPQAPKQQLAFDTTYHENGDTSRPCTPTGGQEQDPPRREIDSFPGLGHCVGVDIDSACGETSKQHFASVGSWNGPIIAPVHDIQGSPKVGSVGHLDLYQESNALSMDAMLCAGDQQLAATSCGAVHRQRKRKKRRNKPSDLETVNAQRSHTVPLESIDANVFRRQDALQTINYGGNGDNVIYMDEIEAYEDAQETVPAVSQAPFLDQPQLVDVPDCLQEGGETALSWWEDLPLNSHSRPAAEFREQDPPAALEKTTSENLQYEHGASSPYSQIHADLQAVALQHNPGNRGDDAELYSSAFECHQRDKQINTLPDDANEEPCHDGYQQQDSLQSYHQRIKVAEPAYPPARPAKHKSKGKRRVTASAPLDLPPSNAHSDFDDHLDDLHRKHIEQCRKIETRFSRERDTLHAQLQQVEGERDTVKKELSGVQRQLDILTDSDAKQKASIAAYGAKIDKFKTFIDGLGHDFDALKTDVSATRRTSEKLSRGAERRMTRQNVFHQELSECANRSMELKNEAIKACHELQSNLQRASTRNEYLEQQVSEHMGMLAEERSRTMRLETQLSNASSDVVSILGTIKQNSTEMLDKLFELHADIEFRDKTKETSELIETTMSTIRQLNSGESDHANDMDSMKILIEGVSKNVESLLEKADDRTAQEKPPNTTDVETTFSNAFKDLWAELGQREKQVLQDTAQRETIAVLQERLNASELQHRAKSDELAAVQAREKELQNQQTILQIKVEALESRPEPDDNQIRNFHTELASQTKALDAIKAVFDQKAEECQALNSSNSKLQSQLQSIRHEMENDRGQVVDLQAQRDELHRQSEAKLLQIREDLARESVKTQMAEKSKMENTVKRIQSQYDDAQNRIQPLHLECMELKAKHAESMRTITELNQAKSKGTQELQKQLRANANEMDGLKATIKELQDHVKESAEIQQRCTDLAVQLAAEKAKAKERAEERDVLTRQLEKAREALHCAQTAKSDIDSVLKKKSIENAAALQKLNEKVAGAKAEAGQARDELEHYKATSQMSAKDNDIKFAEHLQALQQEITRLHDRLTAEERKYQAYVIEVGKTWDQEGKNHNQRLKDATGRTEDAERQRDEALAEHDRLREQLEQILAARSASMPPPSREPLSDRSQGSQTCQFAETAKIRVTPTLTNKENEPSRPTRKRVDRGINAITESGPIPLPDALRAGLHGNQGRGPVVEDSQLKIDLPVPKPATVKARVALTGVSHLSVEDLLDTASNTSNFPTEVVEETQLIDDDPRFADLDDELGSSQPPVSQPDMSTTLSMQGVVDLTVLHTKDKGRLKRTSKQPVQDFEVFQDDTEPAMAAIEETQLPGLAPHVDHRLSSNQEETDFRVQKARANPNTSVKRRSSEGSDSQKSRNHQPATRQPMSHDTEYRVDRAPSTAHSSSSDFVTDPTSARRANTYQALDHTSGSNKHRTTRNDVVSTLDPRLAKCEQAMAPSTKRKAESNIVENYESQRKKRITARENAMANESAGYALRPAARPQSKFSIYEGPLSSSPSSSHRDGNYSQDRGHSSTARVRRPGAQVSRGAKGGKKRSMTVDQMNARFTAELDP